MSASALVGTGLKEAMAQQSQWCKMCVNKVSASDPALASALREFT
jgi:hypothetical protein